MSVADIVIYPIKSCRGISLQSATITPQGLLHDHNFVIAGKRKPTSAFEKVDLIWCPKLAFVQPSIDGSCLIISYTVTGETLAVDLEPDVCKYKKLHSNVMIWKWSHRPIDLGEEAAAFFSSFIDGYEIRLCHKGSQKRFVSGNLPPPGAQEGRKVEATLQSAFPLLLCSASSLDELNSRIPEDEGIEMEQFRGNIIIDGFDPWVEDEWLTIEVGEARYKVHVTCRCWRCPVTQVNLRTAKAMPQPLRELRRYRQIEAGTPRGSPVFGMYALFDCLDGVIRVNDPIKITQTTKEHHFIMP